MSEKNFSSFENLVNLFTNIKNAINKSEGNSALLVKDTVGWTGKNRGHFVEGKTMNNQGQIIDGGANNIATVDPIMIETGKQYKIYANDVFIEYAVFNGTTLVRKSDTAVGTVTPDITGGDRFYVAVSGMGSITIDSAHPMVLYSDCVDTSYEDYHETVEEALEHSGGGGEWGSITGTLSDQEDLQAALDKKFDINSNAYNDIDDSNMVPFSATVSPKTRLVPFGTIKAKIVSLFTDILKNTVGWTGKNMANLSLLELGKTGTGSSNPNYARLSIPCKPNTYYSFSRHASNPFSEVNLLYSETDPPQGIVSFIRLDLTTAGIANPSGGSEVYMIIEFKKSSAVTKADVEGLKLLIREGTFFNDTYEAYHDTVEEELATKYDSGDSAETDIVDTDYIPFYDSSASGQRKSTWANVKAKLKAYFDTVYATVADVVSESLLRDTVGWTGKNKLQNITKNASGGDYAMVTFTYNDDGSIKLSGTATANNSSYVFMQVTLPKGTYILSKSGRTDGYVQICDYPITQELYGAKTSDVEFTLNADTPVIFRFRMLSGAVFNNDVFYPMLRDASITDSTYEPYHPSVDAVKLDQSVMNVMGAKNLLNVPARVISRSESGIDFTVNRDSKGGLTSIVANGTATADIAWQISHLTDENDILGKSCVISGCPAGGSLTTYNLDAYSTGGSSAGGARKDIGEGSVPFTFPTDATGGEVRIIIKKDTVCNNLTFYPMIRLADFTDDTYEPFAKTNKQLTDGSYDIADTNEAGIVDADYIPFYDTSASGKRKTLWSNIKAKLKAYFDTIYATFAISDGFVKNAVGWSGKNLADFVDGKGINISGVPVDDANRIATIEPIPIEAGKRYRVILNNVVFLYAVWNGNTMVRREAGLYTDSIINTDGGDRFYVCCYSSEAITVASARAMVLDADIKDYSYEPYHKSVEAEIEQIYADNGVLGAKNLLKNNASSYTANGLTFTVNDDKSITVNGTATADTYLNVNNDGDKYEAGNYVVSSGVAGNWNTYICYLRNMTDSVNIEINTDSDVSVNISSPKILRFTIFIKNGQVLTNKTFYPMLRFATDIDGTYRPYAQTNKELTDSKMSYADNGVLGAKNWLDKTKYDKYLVTVAQTDTGIRETVSSGTYANVNFDFTLPHDIDFKFSTFARITAGKAGYSLSGSTDKTNWTTIYSTVSIPITSDQKIEHEFNSGHTYTWFRIKLFATIGTDEAADITYDDILLRLASDPDDTYAPYAMTNRELTEAATVTDITSQVTSPEQSHYTTDLKKILKYGKLVEVVMSVISVDITSFPAGQSFTTVKGNLPKGFDDASILLVDRGDGSNRPIQVRVDVNGNLQVRGGSASQSYNVHYLYITKD